MQYLNLDPYFTPFGIERQWMLFNGIMFPSGFERHIKITDSVYSDITITARILNSDDIIEILLAVDAIRRIRQDCNIGLCIPYLPYARQDRVMVKGEPLSIKVMADIINSQNFTEVMIYDAHSDVGPALINNCVNISNHNYIESILDKVEDYWLVSPDSGAEKKIYGLSKSLKTDSIVRGNKHRDVTTGKITGTSIDVSDLKGKDCYIVDDICDGGRTFIELSKILRKSNAGDIYLIVSHGLFTKGIAVLEPFFKGIYTTNSVYQEPLQNEPRILTITELTHGFLLE